MSFLLIFECKCLTNADILIKNCMCSEMKNQSP